MCGRYAGTSTPEAEYPGGGECLPVADFGRCGLEFVEHSMKRLLNHAFFAALALACALAAGPAMATFHTYQIFSIFSNADGTVQYIVLHEALGFNGQNALHGHVLSSSSGGNNQLYVFPSDLPGGEPGDGYGGGMMLAPTASTYVLIATQGFANLNLVTPDYVVPNGFIPLTNGTINYAGVDQISYAALPTDGTSAINRNVTSIQNLATNFAGNSASVMAAVQPPGTVVAVEYYYAAWNYYFETSGTDEIAGLDAGAFGGVWKRTGQTFYVWPTAASNPLGVATCRFFTVFFAPKSSHFYTPNADECNGLIATSQVWTFESIAYYIALIDANGNCPPGTIPLYRFYNNGLGGAPNHRYTTSLTIFNQMVGQGWQFEGHPVTKVFACVPG
jgi:Repeat of unknown function (DUF5648)